MPIWSSSLHNRAATYSFEPSIVYYSLPPMIVFLLGRGFCSHSPSLFSPKPRPTISLVITLSSGAWLLPVLPPYSAHPRMYVENLLLDALKAFFVLLIEDFKVIEGIADAADQLVLLCNLLLLLLLCCLVRSRFSLPSPTTFNAQTSNPRT